MTNRTLLTALDLARAGISVIPVKADGTKEPALSEWTPYQYRVATDTEIEEWFSRPVGLAIVCGKVSGYLAVLDFEYPDFAADWGRLVEMDRPGLIGCLPQIITPGKSGQPGRHVYLRSHHELRGGKLAKLTAEEAQARCGDPRKLTAIEIKAEGGYVLAPGCPAACHPTGRLYSHVGGPFIEETPVLDDDDVELLISYARVLDHTPRIGKPAYVGQARQGGTNDRPGDVFNFRANWLDDVLAPHGWTLVRTKDGVLYLRRPGKDRGISATVGYCKSETAGELLCVFSSNADPLTIPDDRDHQCFSKFGAYAILNHEGNFHAAAVALAKLGYGFDAGTSAAEQFAWNLAEAVEDVEDDAAWETIRQRVLERSEVKAWHLRPEEVVAIVAEARKNRIEHDPNLLSAQAKQEIDASIKGPAPTVSENSEGASPTDEASGAAALPPWHLIVFDGKPPFYRLRAPFWSSRPKVAPSGYIKLSVGQILTWAGIREATLAQADVRIPDKITGWPRLLQRLLDYAEHRGCPNEARRDLVVADFLWGHLRAARAVSVDDNGNPRYAGSGSPQKLKSGVVIVKLKWLEQAAKFDPAACSRPEILECMQKIGMAPCQVGPTDSRSRWWAIKATQLSQMGDSVLNGDGARVLE